ncbi:transposase [Bradyrhizobium sp. 180]|nr:transposase [Bradyrhizobium sp. 180]
MGIDEHGRRRPGERLRASVPHGHSRTTTRLAALSRAASSRPGCSTAVNRDAFEAYVEKVLIPKLPDRAIVVMDNSLQPQMF